MNFRSGTERILWVLVYAGVWSSLALPARAAEPAHTNVLTLDAALQLALTHNPNLRADSSRIEAAAGRAYQARQWPNPELELATEEFPVRSGSFSDAKNTIGIAQTVPWPGKKKLEGRMGQNDVHEAELALRQRKLDLVREVKGAFYRALSAEKQVAMARELAEVAENSATAARKRVEAGAAPDQEQLRAEILLEQARAERAGFKRELAAALQDLATLLGRPSLDGVSVSGDLAEAPPIPEETAAQQLLMAHPAMVAARTARDRADLALRRARLEPYPDVRLGLDGGHDGRDDANIIEFSVSLPLPIWDRSKGHKQEAQANVALAGAELEAIEQQLTRNWATAHQRFATAAEQVAIYRDKVVPRANSALRLVRTGFDEGKFSLIDLLDTQRTTAEARLAFQEKLLELNLAHIELEALLGQSPVIKSTTSASF